ncbi:MAG: L-seryl-tRNA(Sec) selenium transferase [Planctomycetes bacterium]|nr:L-seryl-tRNA(Sec) selenium transferase [Planctomycetota bacterium]
MTPNPFRNLPAVHEILDSSILGDLKARHDHELIAAAVRQALDELRSRISNGEPLNGEVSAESLAGLVEKRLEAQLRSKLRTVINATGIVLHTNLGRAPIAEGAAKAAYEAARGYLNLEMDLETGKRSSRQDAIREWVCRLTGAESATAVNNNAAATVIALRALCAGKEVVVSRGQLIEIGGSFRIPEIMAVSGAILREVGTTNITRLGDYEKAIGPNTAALMRIHPSNYRVSGFTKSVSLTDLVTLARKHNLKVIDDIGSGAVIDFKRFGFAGEPMARASIADGADLTLFSGDKLLGGPQAGILAGRVECIQRIEKDPLMRAMRLDKMTLAALEATLRLYLNEVRALQEVPGLRMLSVPLSELRMRAESLAREIANIAGVRNVIAREDVAYVGGGSLPDQKMPTWVVEIEAKSIGDAELALRLRVGDPAIVGRVQDGKIVFDLRTIFPHQSADVIEGVRKAFAS